ncbi:MAG: metallophosphoesterase [Vicinamibacterales bacterium]
MRSEPSGVVQLLAAAAALAALALHEGCAPIQTEGPATVEAPPTAADVIALPNRADSFKFGVLGDFGSGSSGQIDLGKQMAATHSTFPYELVITVGDNIYGSERPQDFRRKFEVPYAALLNAGVRFYASLGNHDSREQRYYELFNMDGQLYYSFSPHPDIRFFALESTYMEPEQVEWLESELKGSNEAWKIAYFHHPLYSSGERHGSDIRLRQAIEPLLVSYNVSVVFAGHDHFYERVEPQQGIVHFVTGSGGQLRRGNIDPASGITARGYDDDYVFLVAEIEADVMNFQAISRGGTVIDSGIINSREASDAGTQPQDAPASQPPSKPPAKPLPRSAATP